MTTESIYNHWEWKASSTPGRELDDAHDALADAKATATLLKEILKDEANSVRTYTLDSVLAHLEHLHQEHAASAVAACANDQKSLTVKDKFVAFGKYKGKPVADLLKDDNYCNWLKNLDTSDQKMMQFKANVANLRTDKENMQPAHPNSSLSNTISPSDLKSPAAKCKKPCRCKSEVGKPCQCILEQNAIAVTDNNNKKNKNDDTNTNNKTSSAVAQNDKPAQPNGSLSTASSASAKSNAPSATSSAISSSPTDVVDLMCFECEEKPASIKCAHCADLCDECSSVLHGLKARKGHVLEPIVRLTHKRNSIGEQSSHETSSDSEGDGGDSDDDKEGDAEDRWSDSGSDDGEPAEDSLLWEDCSDEMKSIDGPSDEWKLPVREEYKPLVPSVVGIDPNATLTDIFKQLLDGQNFIKLAVKFTNKYALFKQRKKWSDVDEDEMWAFIGLLIFFGRCQLSRADAWKPYPVGNTFVKSVMMFRRFSDLFACFHLVDTGKVSKEAKKKNAFWQMQPLLDIVNMTWPRAYNAGREISIDEATTPEEGRCRAKTYNKDKPHKWGLKDFMLCCPHTGYCFQVHPYQGKDEKRPADKTLAEYAVKSVMLPKFYQAGHLLAIDNWFMCWGVVDFCLQNGIDLVGTLRKGRKGFPSASQYTLDSKERGASKALRRIQGKHAVYTYVWNDNKPVHMVSTFLTPIGRVKRKIKATKDSQFRFADIPQPCSFPVYNKSKGGVDLGDQSTEYVRPIIRSKRNNRNYLLCKMTRNANNARILKGKQTERKIPIKEASLDIAIGLIQPFLQR